MTITHKSAYHNGSVALTFDTTLNSHGQDVVIVIDHSASMNTSVEAKDVNGNTLENGLSIQDIVNHAAKTVAKTLDQNSRLAVIAFDGSVDIVFQLMPMTDENHIVVLSKIATIQPNGQTNIWLAIEKAIEILDLRADKSRNGAILMLTDGAPNVSPARGEVETLKNLRRSKNFAEPIYTFGFGYNLQRDLLYDMAKFANGGNGHIPDGGMIATVFCNFIGIVLTTVATNIQLHIKNTVNLDILMGDFPSYYKTETETVVYDLGTLQQEQPRTVVFKDREGCDCDLAYHYTYKIGDKSFTSDEFRLDLTEINFAVDRDVARFKGVDSIRRMINFSRIGQVDQAIAVLDAYITELKSMASSDMVAGLLKNFDGTDVVQGQVRLAITNQVYYRRWGEFYLDQLSRSLNQQQKPNFKDEACDFGGAIFRGIVDKASDIFDTLPPPIPSRISLNHPSSLASLSSYNNPNGGCIASGCEILMADKTFNTLKGLRQGDSILSMNSAGEYVPATIVCIFETVVTSGMREMVQFPGGLKITPWHPVHESVWQFPNMICESKRIAVDTMITLVLDAHHVMIVNDVICITLAHGFEDPVLVHPYFGSQRVIGDLRMHAGWVTGHIIVKDTDIRYVKEYGMVSMMEFL